MLSTGLKIVFCGNCTWLRLYFRRSLVILFLVIMSTENIHIKAVLFKEGDWWVGQCLDHDIVAQAKSAKDLAYEIQRAVIGHIVVSKQEGLVPFSSLPRAPQKYWDMFDQGLMIQPDRFTLETAKEVFVTEPELSLAA